MPLFFKFFFLETTGLSKIKFVFVGFVIVLFAIPTIGIPSFLYEKFKEVLVLENLNISLGALLAIGYFAIEILLYFIFIRPWISSKSFSNSPS